MLLPLLLPLVLLLLVLLLLPRYRTALHGSLHVLLDLGLEVGGVFGRRPRRLAPPALRGGLCLSRLGIPGLPGGEACLCLLQGLADLILQLLCGHACGVHVVLVVAVFVEETLGPIEGAPVEGLGAPLGGIVHRLLGIRFLPLLGVLPLVILRCSLHLLLLQVRLHHGHETNAHELLKLHLNLQLVLRQHAVAQGQHVVRLKHGLHLCLHLCELGRPTFS
mmetsp:Transcript_143747/g.460078  ORF Transcript_143747/g.460078 Transcript_143747/m.460078 type:complete len:220 (+) Transcript_143747:439-1098(+)